MTTGIYVTPAGLQIPTVEALDALIVADQRSTIDPNLDTDADSPVGQLNGIFESHLREVWEVVAIAYNGFNPDAAEDFTLDALAALTGTTRAPATPSRFGGTRRIALTLNANILVPGANGVPGAGTAFTVNGNPSVRFTLDTDVTSTTAGVYYGDATCTVTGPVNCNANTLTVIATPVAGLTAVNNPFDCELGTNEDTNQQLRQRREEDLRASGAGTLDSIKARIFEIKLPDGTDPVINVTTFENQELFTDPVTGNPGKSVEALVFDGIIPACPNNTIAQVIWNSKPAGIQLVGNTSGTAVDGTGDLQVVPFSRPTIMAVKFNIALSVDSVTYAGDQAVLTEIANYFIVKVRQGGLIRARDYVTCLMGSVANPDGSVRRNVPGVLDVTTMQIAFVGSGFPPSETNLQLTIRQMATADTSNMTLATTPGTP